MTTLYDKLWASHVIERAQQLPLLYIDRHLIHEVTSPQAFEGLRLKGRKPWDVRACLAVPDHNVPTQGDREQIDDAMSALQVDTLTQNCEQTAVPLFHITDPRQGIVHVIGPEQGFTLPGTTVVCGDSHTSTHGAFGALAFGIGTSEVEHVLATQTLPQKKLKNFQLVFEGALPAGVSAKDMVLAAIREVGTAGGTGYAIEFAGSAVAALEMEGRMTLCNMAIEAGARAGLIAPDETTFAYLKGRPLAPKGALWEQACESWRALKSDSEAYFDKTLVLSVEHLLPQLTWGTSPEMVVSIDEKLPSPQSARHESAAQAYENAYAYMGLKPGMLPSEIPLDKVFIGSCTNSRLSDLQAAANIVKGAKVAPSIKQAIVVPGSGLVKAQAEALGLDVIFKAAGFEWRAPGCSMCIAMNPDKLQPGERCASTSNRNFEGRQGQGGRTHLVSPAMAAAAAIEGRFVDIREVV